MKSQSEAEFQKYKESQLKIARQLGYSKEIQKRISDASKESQIVNIMVDARKEEWR